MRQQFLGHLAWAICCVHQGVLDQTMTKLVLSDGLDFKWYSNIITSTVVSL